MKSTLRLPVGNPPRLSGACASNDTSARSDRPVILREFRPSRFILLGVLAAAACCLVSPAFAQHRYQQTNLVSDVPGLAAATDSSLVNPWGLSHSATSPWWVADNGAGLSTLYNGAGARQTLVVTIPPPAGQTDASAPTGTVFNGSTDFEVGPGQPARFLFVTENGTIAGWNPAANATTAVVKVDNSGAAIYKGLALGQVNGVNHLYAADFHGGKVDIFDKDFNPVDLGAGAFHDPRVPAGYAPFNVQAVGDWIVVTYAKQDADKIDEVAGPGRGFVTAFGPDGAMRLRLRWGPWFNAPWGVALAPADFGRFSGKLLVGQFGSGRIAAFDPASGNFRGVVRDTSHRPLQIDGLWALAFGNGANAGPANTLFFTAGINDEAHGLFGTITPVTDSGGADQDTDEGKDDKD